MKTVITQVAVVSPNHGKYTRELAAFIKGSKVTKGAEFGGDLYIAVGGIKIHLVNGEPDDTAVIYLPGGKTKTMKANNESDCAAIADYVNKALKK